MENGLVEKGINVGWCQFILGEDLAVGRLSFLNSSHFFFFCNNLAFEPKYDLTWAVIKVLKENLKSHYYKYLLGSQGLRTEESHPVSSHRKE